MGAEISGRFGGRSGRLAGVRPIDPDENNERDHDYSKLDDSPGLPFDWGGCILAVVVFAAFGLLIWLTSR